MRRFIFFILILCASVFIGVKIAEDPGYVLFAYRHWTVEMPLWFMVVATLFALSILYYILRFFDGVDATWGRWKNWLQLRRKQKSLSKTNRGLLEMIEARWKNAENNLMAGVDQSEAPLINFLAAAKAAQEQAAYDRRDGYLRKAYDVAPNSKTVIGIAQAELQLSQGRLEQALSTLTQLRNENPRHPLILKLLERVYIHLGDWKNLLKLAPDLKKVKLITAEQLSMLENKTYQEILFSNNTSMLPPLREVWAGIPKKNQQDPDVVYAYVKQLLHFPDTANEIDELIVKTLKKSWHKELVHVYGSNKVTDTTRQLKNAENWLKQYGAHAMLFLTLGRISMRCQIWGKARSYFEEGIKLEAMPELFLEYGNVLAKLGEQQAAQQTYKMGLKACVKA